MGPSEEVLTFPIPLENRGIFSLQNGVVFFQPQKMDNFQNFGPSYEHMPSSEFFKAQLRQNLV